MWALPVRGAHWILAGLVLYNLWADTGPAHRFAGYAAAAVVLLRLLAGLCCGASHSVRLRWPGLAACRAHGRQILAGRVASRAGHNPLGAAMSLAIWGLVLLLGLSGWISRWDRFWGEDWVADLHSGLATALEILVVCHLIGVLASSVVERQNLAWAMVTGRKRVDTQD